jgi:hypothetical protein
MESKVVLKKMQGPDVKLVSNEESKEKSDEGQG